ncbi:MAG: hypothetical protein PHS27_01670 [Candidatus Pacebacteria bacterium]|nr:hypothetical protein [Candidatus Paceibacterota bacterium]
MKRALVISLVCFVLAVAWAIPSFAQATVVDWTFTGAGVSSLTFTPDNDAIVNLFAAGNNVTATGQCTDANNNPYGYNVDSVTAWLRGTTTNGGQISLQLNRLGSYVPMYGPAGQISLWEVFSSDGTASLAARTSMNYASMIDSQYGFQANGQLQASGTTFYVLRQITNGTDWGLVQISGNGSGTITCMNSGANGTGYTLEGWTGCYKNDSATMSGASTIFLVQAFAEHAMTWENGSSTGATSYLVQVTQEYGSATIKDWWTAGN